jgi:hypothetical protein
MIINYLLQNHYVFKIFSIFLNYNLISIKYKEPGYFMKIPLWYFSTWIQFILVIYLMIYLIGAGTDFWQNSII